MHTSTNLTLDMNGGQLRQSRTTVIKDQAQEAAGRALSVTEKVDLVATPSQAWESIKDFEGWQSWHPAFASTEIIQGQGNTQGTVRVLTAKDCARFTEELLAHSAALRSYQYRIIESPLPITGYVSTIEVRGSQGGSSVVWRSSFQLQPGAPEQDIKQAISAVYRAGLDNLSSVLKLG